jgi:hypothetical protein
MLKSALGEFPGIIDQDPLKILACRVVLFSAFALTLVVLFNKIFLQSVVSILIREREIIYRSIRGELCIKIDDVTTYRLMGRYTSGFSTTFKLWHSKGKLLITNHEFGTDQVFAMAKMIDSSFNSNKKNKNLQN